ncbi:60S acidic ribosomal protein P0 [Senna tora]|uniref:60S acidic ribosomal protein P0 n=1 Tax=Senna tora TaxID=362788 RepID=A0A834WEV5_9FABA|nr:60S acidic ribosomal protein P0 [Senna tora]
MANVSGERKRKRFEECVVDSSPPLPERCWFVVLLHYCAGTSFFSIWFTSISFWSLRYPARILRREAWREEVECDKCSKPYIVQSDWKAHSKICSTKGNVGLIFTKGDLKEVSQEVGAPAVGLVVPIDVVVPPGSTGLDPSRASLFQVCNLGLKELGFPF